MPETTLFGAFGSAATVAGIVVAVTQWVRAEWPAQMTNNRTIAFTWCLAPLLMLGAWAIGFTAPGLSWREAAALGFNAALLANGIYAAGKALIKAPNAPFEEGLAAKRRAPAAPAEPPPWDQIRG